MDVVGRRSILGFLVRSAERTLDYQAQAIQRQADRSQQMIAVGVASLGGASALALFASSQLEGTASPWFLGPIALGAVANLLALWGFVQTHLGAGFEGIEAGPSPARLWERARGGSGLRALQAALVASAAGYFRANQRLARRLARRQRRASRLLLTSVMFYGLALAFIVGRGIV